MVFVWVLFSILAGVLLSFSQAFQWEDLKWDPNWLSLLSASFGLALWMKVSSLRSRFWVRFLVGFSGAFVYFLIALFWITIALREIGELALWISVLGCVALAAFCSIYFGLWSGIAGLRWVKDKSIFNRILIWSSLFASLGLAREILFTGFTWAEPATLFAYFPMIGRSAWFWGLHGISFFWMFSLCLLIHSDECFSSKKSRWVSISVLSLFFVVILASHLLPARDSTASNIRVALIQPNISQDMKWSPEEARDNLNNLIQLTREALEKDPDLIVWPETSYPYPVFRNQIAFPIHSDVPLVIGAVMKDGRINFNTAILIEQNERKAYFSKIHLVPFGEYVPFEDLLPIEKLVANTGRFLPGSTDQNLLSIEEGRVRMGPLICYEDIFVRHSVRHARAGANFLLNLTNDAWYRKSSALPQHAALAQIQVYSTGLPMVRSTNTGLTTSMSFWSRHDFEMHKRGFFISEVPYHEEPKLSFFTWSFPFMQWIWPLLFAIGLLWNPGNTNKRIFFRR